VNSAIPAFASFQKDASWRPDASHGCNVTF
jgi:hypothetical protein